MANIHDRPLTELEIPAAVVRKLSDLAILGVRQLHARLQREAPHLRKYLDIPETSFLDLNRQVEEVIKTQFPEDLTPPSHPPVNKRGVAAHRLNDPKRPKHRDSEND